MAIMTSFLHYLYPLKFNINFPERPIASRPEACGFHTVGMQLQITDLQPFQPKCGGKMCDKQKLISNGNINNFCSCIQMNVRSGVVGITIKIIATLADGSEITFNDFSSQHFFETFVVQSFPVSVRADDLNQLDQLNALEDAADNVVEYVNARGGWSGFGWTKQGQIVDEAARAAAGPLPYGAQPQLVAGGSIRHHLVRLYPTNPALVDYQAVKDLKIDLVASRQQ